MTQLNLDNLHEKYLNREIDGNQYKKAILAWGKQQRIDELEQWLVLAKWSNDYASTKKEMLERIQALEAKEG